MIFNAIKITHPVPQLSVVNADSSSIPITYPQIKQSLGNDIYNVDAFYIYSPNVNQLQGQIQYVRFDASGNQVVKSLITTVDPYNFGVSIVQKVDQNSTLFILHGNSNFSTTVLPSTGLQVKFFSRRVSTSLIRGANNFEILERIFRLGGFADSQLPKLDNQLEYQEKTQEPNVEDTYALKEKTDEKYKQVYINSFVALASGILAYLIIKSALNDREY